MSAPPVTLETEVRSEWVDVNEHMNVAYYVLAFDWATDALFEALDVGRRHIAEDRQSMFALEAHVTYQAELRAGERLRVTTQLLDADAKRLHFFHRMTRLADGVTAATSEWLALHVDLASRRAAPFPPAIARRVTAMREAHAGLARPAEVGRVIGIGRLRG